METKKWSTKKKVLVSILVILCAAIIAGVDILADLDIDSQDFCAVYRDKVPLLRR